MNQVYISDLSQQLTKRELIEYFSSFGPVASCETLWLSHNHDKSAESLQSKCEETIKIGKILFQSKESVKRALNCPNHSINGIEVFPRSPCESELGISHSNDLELSLNRVCVFKVPKHLQNDQLAEVFSQFGPILKVFIKKNKFKSTNHAFITYLCNLSVLKALKQKKLTILNGSQLSIVPYKKKDKGDKSKHNSNSTGDNYRNAQNDSQKKKKKRKNGGEEIRNFEQVRCVNFDKKDFYRNLVQKIHNANPEMKRIDLRYLEQIELFYFNKLERAKQNWMINYNSIVKRFAKRINENHKKRANVILRRSRHRGRPVPGDDWLARESSRFQESHRLRQEQIRDTKPEMKEIEELMQEDRAMMMNWQKERVSKRNEDQSDAYIDWERGRRMGINGRSLGFGRKIGLRGGNASSFEENVLD
jgi:RNA recognition motif-containing protein